MTKSDLNNQQIAEKLAESLESTSRGLAVFSRSAEPFREALKPYQQMQIVLMQQRLWSKRHKRDDLDPLWRKIAASSRELHSVFSGFAGVMDVLRFIDTVEEPAGPVAGNEASEAPEVTPAALDRDEAAVDWLNQALAAFKLSPAQLAALGRRQDSETHITNLVRVGVFEPCGRGSYRLTKRARRRMAWILAK